MNAMNRLILKYLKSNKKRTFISLFGIILSVSLIVGVFSIFSSFRAFQREMYIENDVVGEWHISGQLTDFNKVKEVVNKDEVKSYFLNVLKKYNYYYIEKNHEMPIDFSFFSKSGLNHIKLSEGKIPSDKNEILISKHLSEKKGNKKIGDDISFDFAFYDENKAENNSKSLKESFKISGIIDPSNSFFLRNDTAFGYFDESSAFSENAIYEIKILLKDYKNSVKFKKDLNEKIGKNEKGEDIFAINKSLLFTYGIFEDKGEELIYNIFLQAAITMILIVSILLIYNMFSISIAERVRDMGMLSSIGASRKQKFLSSLFEGFCMFSIAVPIGILTGILGSFLFLTFFNTLMMNSKTKINLVISFYDIVIASLISFITVFLSVLMPAIKQSRITIINAIRQNSEINLKRKKLKTSKIINNIFGFEGTLALKNLKRNKSKYRSTLLSLIFSVFLFLVTNSAMNIYRDLQMNFLNRFEEQPGDIDIIYYGDHTDEQIKINKKNIENMEGVKRISFVKSAWDLKLDESVVNKNLVEKQKEISSKESYFNPDELFSYQMTAFDDDVMESYLTSIGEKFEDYNDLSNIKVLANNEILLTKKIEGESRKRKFEFFNVQKNEKIKFFITSGGTTENKTKKEMEMSLGAFYKEGPMFSKPGFDGITFLTTKKIVRKIIEEKNNLFKLENPDATAEMKENIDRENRLCIELSEEIKKDSVLRTKLSDNIRNMENHKDTIITDRAANKEAMAKGEFTIFATIYSFIGFISLVCLANLINTIGSSIALRRREFAILASIGITPKSFNKMINFESLFYSIKAIFYGFTLANLSFFLIVSLANSSNDNSDYISFKFDWIGTLVASLGVILFVSISMYFASKKIKKENVIDVLKLENI